MKNLRFLIIVASISSIVLGIVLATQFQIDYIHPLDEARGMLVQVQATSDPIAIHSDLDTVKRLLPVAGNPAWISPTEDTDFGIMQNDLQTMLGTVDNIAYAPSWSSGFHTGMLNVHSHATILVFDIIDATPYLYASPPFILANFLWLLGTMGLASFMGIKKK
ncbi:MAG: hypothetical protein ACREBI_10120 [Nitrosotalea sp.]